jgi:cytochrome c peroxidase
MKYFFITLLCTIALINGCQKEDILPTPMVFYRPPHFPNPTYDIQVNTITEEGFALGKKLFDDPILSKDYSISCSSCHVKGVAFTDPQHTLSLGVENRHGIRNAPSITNMAFMKEFMWDGRVSHLDFAPPNAIENPIEMDISLNEVVHRLNSDRFYPTLFKSAYPTMDTITAPYLLKTLSQYQLMLVSATSNYDKVKTGKYFMTQEEQQGQLVFNEKCATCHEGELFTNQGFENNGLDATFVDLGRAKITEHSRDKGKFKVPSLRNIELTDPYMHDGRFKTIDEVLDHYSHGVKISETLSVKLIQGNTVGIPLSLKEKSVLKSFLLTLTDRDFLSNPKF